MKGRWLLGVTWFVWVGGMVAQERDFSAERKRLERQRQQIEVELRQTQALLHETRQQRRRSLGELALLRRQIALQERLLRSIHQEIAFLDQDIFRLARVNQALERDLRRLYRNYVWSLYLLEKSQRHISPWVWIISAESFQQAYERLFYFRAVSRFRQEQLWLITRTRRYLEGRTQVLRKSREEKARLLLLYAEQAAALQRSRSEKKALYESLRLQEVSYRKRVSDFRRRLQEIQARIDALIRAEVERTRKSAVSAADVRLTGAFEQNRGNLPWPIASDKAVVLSPFGTVEDESGGLITNQGVYLAGPAKAEVRAVFSGKVTAVATIPGQGKVVILQHGSYRTVYARLEEVFVLMGQAVSLLEPVGRLGSASEAEPPQLYFLLYKGKTPLNPLEWISSR